MKRVTIKRKGYRKPVMMDVKLQNLSQLLASSGGDSTSGGGYSTSASGNGTGTKNYIWNTPTFE